MAKPKEKIRALAFDLGSVLVDVDFTPMFNRILPHTDYLNLEDLRRVAPIHEHHFRSESARRFNLGSMSSNDYYKTFCSEVGIDEGSRAHEMCSFSYDNFVHAFSNNVFSEIEEMSELIAEVSPQLEMMIMITNINELHYDFLREKFPHVFKPFGQNIIASYRVKLMKPDDRIYKLAIKRLASRGIRREEALFIDDMAENTHGAKGVKIKTFWFDRKTPLPKLMKELKGRLRGHGLNLS
ncbi:MAG: HAD hydrolase-like protein [bacterium]|nr:HAD hydrolase-like protein [bacterium]